MNIEDLKSIMDAFDPASLLPEMESILNVLVDAVRLAILAGPIVVLAFGVLFLVFAPKEANYKLGYRCFWGMSSVEAWQFTQKLAGIVWSILGFVLCIVMTVQSGKFQGMEADAMAYLAMKYLLVELVCVVVSILLINLTVFVCFNHKGILREFLQRGPSQRSPRNRANRR